MCPLRYYPMLRRTTEPTCLRFELVRYAREHGLKPMYLVRSFAEVCHIVC